MSERYSEVVKNKTSEEFTKYSTVGIILRVLELVQFILITAYCFLSHSFETAIAFAIMLSNIALIFNKRYVYDKKEQVLQGQFDGQSLRPIQTRRYLWLAFLIQNIGFTIFKAVYFISGNLKIAPEMQQALEVQSPVYAFVPCVFIFTTAPLVLLKHRNRPLSEFKEPIGRFPTILMYSGLLILLVIDQFLNISLLGLTLILVVAGINAGHRWDFIRKRWIVYFTVCFTYGWMIACYICSIEVLQLDGVAASIIGVRAMQSSYITQPQYAFFILSIFLTYLLGNWMNRLYSYEIVRKKFSEDREQYLIHRQKAKKEEGEEEQDEDEQVSDEVSDSVNTNEVAVNVARSQSHGVYYLEANSLEYQTVRADTQSNGSRGPETGRQIQLSNRIDMAWSNRERVHTQLDDPRKSLEIPLRKGITQVDEQVKIVDRKTVVKEQKLQTPAQKGKFAVFSEMAMKFLGKFSALLVSVHFNFRLMQLVSIVMIQRYNTIYSFIIIIWLLLSSIFTKITFLRWSTLILVLPTTLLNYFPLYYTYIPESIQPSSCGIIPCTTIGFNHYWQYIWIDVLIFNYYIYLILTFLKITTVEILKQLKKKRREEKRKKKKAKNIIPEVSYWKIFIAFVFKYTYLITLILMFVVGFSEVNLIHLGFSLLFLIFFAVGQQLIVRTITRDNIPVKIITTFSQKNWIVIVNFTGIIILLKYFYFLFFSQYSPAWMELTGINKVYNTSFNFSLSSYCPSQTTYFFLIYILAVLQLQICRSSIYKEMSIDLMHFIAQKEFFKKRWQTISLIWEVASVLYYQGLFLVSAIVVLICSYQWSINGIIISISVTFGVVYGFGKGRIWIVAMWSNLTFIAVNYLLCFLTYPYVQDLLTQDRVDLIVEFAIRLGFFDIFSSKSNQLLFLNNIIIYWFCVMSSQLYKILMSKYLYPAEAQNVELEKKDSSRMPSSKSKSQNDKQSSSKMSSVELNHDLNRNNSQFAESYLKNVILVTCQCYEKDLSDYKFIKTLQQILAFFITDLALIFVIVCCLYFRLAITMAAFLTIYLLHFLLQFRKITKVLKETGYLNNLYQHLKKFDLKQQLMYADSPVPAYPQQQNFEDFQNLIFTTKLRIMVLKQQYKKRMWPFAAFLSFLCLISTYTLQLVTQDFCGNTCSPIAFYVQKSLLILGVSTTSIQNLWSEIYFYFFMIFISMLERHLLVFSDKQLKKEREVINKVHLKAMEKLKPLDYIGEEEEDDQQNSRLRMPIMQEKELFESDIIIPIERPSEQKSNRRKALRQSSQSSQVQQQQVIEQAIYQQANLVFFYTFSQAYIKVKSMFGIMSLLLRFYVFLLLINCSVKSNVFSWVYLGIAGVFWVKSIRFEMLEYINRICIVLLLIQYFLFLLNINPSSPGYSADYAPYTLIGKVLFDQNWVSYLAFGGVPAGETRNSNGNVAFIVNSVVVFATEYYFSIYYLITLYTLKTFKKLKNKYAYILQELLAVKKLGVKIYINYECFKSFGYRFLRKLYETLTVHYHIILSLLILLTVLTFDTIVSIALMVLAAIYFCLIIFFRGQQEQQIQKYTYIYFYICKAVTFLQLILITIFHIPVLLNLCANSSAQSALHKVCNQIAEMSLTGDLFLLFFVQLWFDMYESQQYRRFLKEYQRGHKFIHKLMTKCYVYRLNDQKLKDMYREYQEIINFHSQVESAMVAIEEWHKIMKKQVDSGQYRNQFDRLKKLRKTVRVDFADKDDDMTSPVSTLTHKIQRLLNRSMNHTLYQSVPSLVNELKTYNSRIFGDVKVTCHDYVTQNFEYIDSRLNQLDNYYKQLFTKIQKCQPGEVQQLISRQMAHLQAPPSGINDSMIMPPLLQSKEIKVNLGFFQSLFYFTLSRFDDLVLLFILMYYMVNPCLASFPIVILILTYEIIADIKRKNWLLVYIVLLIATIQVVQQYTSLSTYDQQKGFGPETPPTLYSWFFFYDPAVKATFYSTGYLQFLLVMILLNELLKMWVGVGDKEPVQVQNLYQALIRCEINSRSEASVELAQIDDDVQDSEVQNKLDITKNLEHPLQNKSLHVDEKDRNPYQVSMQQLQDNPKLILDENANTSFFKKLRLMRDGIDLYPFIASVQITIIIYLIIFYQAMQNTNQDLAGLTNLATNKFSAPLILTVLLYVVISVVERWIAIMAYERGYKELVKYIYTIFLLALVCLQVYVFAPYDKTGVERTYRPTPALIGFMFLQFLYFIFSCWQIKWGYKKYKRLNSMLHKRTYINYYVTSVFTAIPFLYELKLIMDWTFCKTGLTLENWVRHFNMYLTSFMSTINSISAKQYKLGDKMPTVNKILYGWCGFILILLLIFGPMILFSGLNPVSQANLVVGGQLQIGIQVESGNYFQLYATSHFAQPPVIVSETLYNQMGFNEVPLLASMSPSERAQQFQMVNYYPYSDNMWDISTPNFQSLVDMIGEALNQYENNQTLTNSFIISTKYELIRQISDTVSSPTSFQYPFMNGTQIVINKLELNQQQLQSLYNTLTICNKTAVLDEFYIALVRLDTQGNSFKPRPIIKNGTNNLPMYLQNVALTLNCNKAIDNKTSSATNLYWQLTLNGNSQGIVMYVLSDKYTTLSFGFTFVGLYTSIIFVIAGFLRGFFTGSISLIPYNLNPRPEAILCICEAIQVVRMRQNLRQEVLLFYELVDIMRSPEIIKYMCGNYTKFIKDEDLRKIEIEKANKAKTE